MADWAKLKVVDLKAELKRRDLPQHGLKAELVARLNEAKSDATPAEDDSMADADEAEPALPAEDGAPEAEVPAAPKSLPETTAEPLESKEINISIEATAESIVSTAETQPAVAEQQPLPTIDASNGEPQKRKRSATPSPSAEETAAKRARALPEQEMEQEHAISISANEDVVVPADEPAPMDVEQTPPPPTPPANEEAAQPLPTSSTPPPSPPPTAHVFEIIPSVAHENSEIDMDMDHSVAPALHPATTALYISNLMRPLRPADVQSHVRELASTVPDQAASAGDAGDDVIVQFHLDQIRTHAFVVLASVQAAARVRAQLHDRIWPDESNRKALCVDFVPPEKVNDWIAMEQGSGSAGAGRPGRSTARWEVVYDKRPDGVVEARLQQVGGLASRPGPPPPPVPFSQAGVAATDLAPPTGPRGDRDRGRDRGRDDPASPRGGNGRRDGHSRSQQNSLPQPSELDYELQRTRARPSITFQLVAPTLATRRVDNMRSFYTKDARRVLGREINRYSFEEGDSFVDRGKEVFEGIRPPHRERGGGGGRSGRGGGGGGGKFGGRGGGRGRRGGGGGDRPQGDRYLPGFSSRGGGGRRWDDDRGRDRRY